MSKRRLNEDARAAILESAMARRFMPQMEAIARAQAELARVIYDKLFPPEVQKIVGELPDYWFDTASTLRVRDAKGMTFCVALEAQLHFRDSAIGFMISSPRVGVRLPMPARYLTFLIDDQDAEAYRALIDQWDELAAHMRSTVNTAAAVLRKASSVSGLIALWPEIEPLIPQNVLTPAAPASAVVTSDLNQLLGLPIGETKEP